MTFEELQRQEVGRLNNALVSQSLQPQDKKLLTKKMFNPKIAQLVEGLTKIAKVKTDQEISVQAENLLME